MKKMTGSLLALTLFLGLMSGCGSSKTTTVSVTTSAAAATAATTPPETITEAPTETTAPVPAIEKLVIGTTAAIEKAVAGEYNYEMLASGVAMMPLVYQDVTGSFHPLLASYETKDAATWTYTVLSGMTWSDGVPVTAEDILFTLQYEDAKGSAHFNDKTGDNNKVTKAKYSGYELSADKMSISLTLASANVRELSNMTSFRVLPKHVLENKEQPTEAELRVTCGPYVLDSFSKEAGTLTFKRNSYFPEMPSVDTIVYQLFGNEDTMYLALTGGDIDMVWNYSTGVSANYQALLEAEKAVSLISVSAANEPAVLAFNNAKGPFADKNLRKAVASALNYETFKTYFGSAFAEIPHAGFVPTATIGYKETAKLVNDSEKAAGYMKAAGYETKNDKGFYVNSEGKEAGFTLTVNARKTAHVSCAELVKTQLEDFGIRVTLETLDADSYNAKTSNKFSENNITMEAAIYGYTAAGMGMMDGLGSIYVNGNHAVQGGCQVFDETFRTILSEMSAALTIEEYAEAAGKLQDFYADSTPLVALYWDTMVHAVSSSYENIVVDYTFGVNNIPNWFSITAR